MEITAKPQTIHLQALGKVQAKPASEFKIGDTMVWNYGYTSKVEGIAKETEKTVVYKISWTDNSGPNRTQVTHYGERKFLKSRLVAFK